MDRLNGAVALGIMFIFSGVMGLTHSNFPGSVTMVLSRDDRPNDQLEHEIRPQISPYLSGGVIGAGIVLVGLGLKLR